jgi:hypothetical protein
MRGRTTRGVLLLATPAALYAAAGLSAFFLPDMDFITAWMAVGSVITLLCLIFLFFKDRSARIKYVSIVLLAGVFGLWFSPGIVYYWYYTFPSKFFY